jgi:hypothetical protein
MNINEVLEKITKKLLDLLREAWSDGFEYGFSNGSHDISPEVDEELKVMNEDIQSLFKNPKEHKIV